MQCSVLKAIKDNNTAMMAGSRPKLTVLWTSSEQRVLAAGFG
jgi:hypothetical protein